MTREACEKAIMEHLIAIADIYKEYHPEGNYLSLSVLNRNDNGNGNDFGDWDTRSLNCNNLYYEDDKDKPIRFEASIDIEDERYHKAMDALYEKYPKEKGNYPIEWHYFSWPEHLCNK